MSNPYQLAAMIDMVAPRVDPALVCRDNMESILAVARVLPQWQCAGFECRLGDAAPRADFGVHLRRKHRTSIGGIPHDSGTGDAWRRLARFADAWAESHTVMAQSIPAVSLEFDLHTPDAVPAPSVFFSIHPGRYATGVPTAASAASACCAVVSQVLEALDIPLADARQRLEECLQLVLQKVSFVQFGVWLARPVNTFRICAPGIRLQDIDAVVRALRGSGPDETYASCQQDLLGFVDRGSLHLDIGHDVSAKIGVEVCFGESSVGFHRDDPDDTRFFDYLVDHELCLPEKRDALFAWVGGFRIGDVGAGADGAPFFLRTISHVKLVFQPGARPEAKAYIAVGRLERTTEH